MVECCTVHEHTRLRAGDLVEMRGDGDGIGYVERANPCAATVVLFRKGRRKDYRILDRVRISANSEIPILRRNAPPPWESEQGRIARLARRKRCLGARRDVEEYYSTGELAWIDNPLAQF